MAMTFQLIKFCFDFINPYKGCSIILNSYPFHQKQSLVRSTKEKSPSPEIIIPRSDDDLTIYMELGKKQNNTIRRCKNNLITF